MGAIPVARTYFGFVMGGWAGRALASRAGRVGKSQARVGWIGTAVGISIGLMADAAYFSHHPLANTALILSSIAGAAETSIAILNNYVPAEHTGR